MLASLHGLLSHLYNVRGLIEWGGTALVCVIVFAETGLFVGFFLPGDSLLVTAGLLAVPLHLRLGLLLPTVTLCAIAGDQLGYLIGRRMGASLYQREDSRFFKKRHVESAHEFYERYGGKTVILARFVPIIRTFCPPVAGAARMKYARYLAFDIVGGISWACGLILGGYLLGRAVPHIDQEIHYVIAVVIALSLMPPAYHAWRARRRKGGPGDSINLKSAPPQED